jgi:putative holliday junction resolvase
MTANSQTILALDVGERRIGVARAHVVARLASPLTTLDVTDHIIEDIRKLAGEQEAGLIVIGIPRNLKSEDTDQTRYVRTFAEELQTIGVDTVWQDEALTSHKAEKELQSLGRPFTKADIDALAATYILEDYLRDNSGE